jgi:hypothetical protein
MTVSSLWMYAWASAGPKVEDIARLSRTTAWKNRLPGNYIDSIPAKIKFVC